MIHNANLSRCADCGREFLAIILFMPPHLQARTPNGCPYCSSDEVANIESVVFPIDIPNETGAAKVVTARKELEDPSARTVRLEA